MAGLPSGTVSMLFSDIEGSTLLLSRLGPHYRDALDAHRRIMRAAWKAHGGTEMGTEGDSFFVVFPTAGGAVRAAAEAGRGLAKHPWPEGEVLRVRIGIHTGSPQVYGGDYWGMDVHRAARIAASAHGGQVVMSATTTDLVRAELPDGASVRDLGLHLLKDIPAPERIYQLVVEDLPQDFPPLRTLGTSSSLPHSVTPLIGREHDIEALAATLDTSVERLVTLTGTGGSGKTRLAVAVAESLVKRYADGVFFVPLAPVTTAEVMWTSVAEALGVPPRERPVDRLLTSLAPRSLLIVLDNIEQVAGADEVVAALLHAAPGIALIATSRQPLGLDAERRWAVAPLDLPEDATVESAAASGAVQLFAHRARNVRPDFELTAANVRDVVAICRRLDGLPLAIELCASQSRVLSPRALSSRLDGALDIASTNRLAPARQRTLRDTITWSYQLLKPDQQGFFRRLGVFAGGGDLEAVAAVTGTGDPLGPAVDLVDANLVGVGEGPDGEPRLTLLETIRAFALDQLRASGDLNTSRAAHGEHYTRLAERLQRLRESKHLAALEQAELELDNFREALAWALPPEKLPEKVGPEAAGPGSALRLGAALSWLWWMGGYVPEGREWLERIIDRTDGSASADLAACLASLANLLVLQGEAARAREIAEQSLAMARSLGDEPTQAHALGVLGTAEQQLGDSAAARTRFEQSAEALRHSGDQPRLARALGHLAGIEGSVGNVPRAESLLRESLQILDALGDLHEATVQRQNLANLLAIAGRTEEAEALAGGLVEAVLQLDSPTLTMAFANTYMNILIRVGDAVRAAELFGAEEQMHARLAIPNPYHDEELDEAIALVAGTMSADEWNRHRDLGRGRRVEDLLAPLAHPRR